MTRYLCKNVCQPGNKIRTASVLIKNMRCIDNRSRSMSIRPAPATKPAPRCLLRSAHAKGWIHAMCVSRVWSLRSPFPFAIHGLVQREHPLSVQIQLVFSGLSVVHIHGGGVCSAYFLILSSSSVEIDENPPGAWCRMHTWMSICSRYGVPSYDKISTRLSLAPH